MISRERFNKAAALIPALYTERHSHIVAGLIKWLEPRIVVEIGCFKGAVTVHAARALQELGGRRHLNVVDNFSEGSTIEDVKGALKATGTSGIVGFSIGRSSEVNMIAPVDLAIIDGHHGPEECWGDCRRVMARGAKAICLHDTYPPESLFDCPGPLLALAQLRALGWQTLNVEFDRGYGVALRA